MRKPFKDFDLPKYHVTAERHYVPPKARRPSERERRHELPRGTLLAEHQARGSAIVAFVLNNTPKYEDRAYVSKLFAASAYNTAWYGIARHSQTTMRSRLKLPDVVDGYDKDEFASHTTCNAGAIAVRAHAFAGAIADMRTDLTKSRLELGRDIGHLGLRLACADLRIDKDDTPFTIQDNVRHAGLTLVNNAQELSDEIGSPASFAQLPDVDSDLSLHIRRTAPNGVYQAYSDALEVHRIAV